MGRRVVSQNAGILVVLVGSGNGLLPAGTKPLTEVTEPVSTSFSWGSVASTWEHIHSVQAALLYYGFEDYILKNYCNIYQGPMS